MAGTSALEIQVAPAHPEERFGAFVVSHRDRARRLAWRLLGGDEDAAADVCQEAFVKAYAGLDRFREDSSLATWFYRILVREAHRHRRWRAVRNRWNGAWREEVADPAAGAPGDPGLERRIARALDKLTRKQREAFVLVHVEGFTVRECAELLGNPTGTVKSHLHRALRTLRAQLADLHDSEGGPRR